MEMMHILAMPFFGLVGAAAFALKAVIVLGVMMLQMALRKKPKAGEKNSPNNWNPQTVQRAGIPIDLIYGVVKVQGNAFSQYTEIDNTIIEQPALFSRHPVIVIINVIRLIFGLPPLLVTDSAYYVTASKEKLNVRLGIGDGPLEGPVDGTETVNNLLIENAEGVTVNHRYGTDSQTATGMGDIFQFPHEEYVAEGSSVTLFCPDKDYDDTAIMLYSPEGLVHYASDGDRVIACLEVKIEIRIVGGAWNTIFDGVLAGKTANPVYWRFLASGTYDGGTPFTVTQGDQHEWRVTLVSTDGTSNTMGKLYIWAGQQIYNDAHTFPGLAFTEIQAYPSEKINGSLQYDGVWQGKIVEDVETGELAWSDNPANVIRDLLCRPCISGSGESGDPYVVEYYRGYNPSKLNTADFVALKNWCDELMDNGLGYDEKQFRFNGRFSDRDERWAQADKVARMCRANLWYDGDSVRVWIDRAKDATHLICSANMFAPYGEGDGLVDDVCRERSLDSRLVPSEIETDIFNEDSNYGECHVLKVDAEATTSHKEDVEGFGIPNVGQFVRLADFLFAKAKNQDLVYQFQMDVNGLDIQIGDTAYIQSDSNGRGIGTCVTDATTTTVTLDKPLTMNSGTTYTLIVQTITVDGKYVDEYDVASLTGEYTVNIDGSFTRLPQPGDCCIFTETAKIDKCRIVSCQRSPDGRCVFVAEQYKAAFYASDGAIPDYDTNLYVSDTGKGSNSWQPVSREDLSNSLDEDRVYGGNVTTQPVSGDLIFTGDNVDTVTWEGTDFDGAVAWIRVNGESFPIESDAVGTTDKYIYFDALDDSSNDRTILQHTNNLEDLRGSTTRYLGCINVNGVPYPKGWVLVGKDSALDINADDITQGVMGTNSFMETFEDPDNDIATRWLNYGGSGELSTQAGGESGTNYLQVGNDSGDDMATLVYKSSLVFDPALCYRVRIRVRQSSGVGTIYAGLAGRNAADDAWVNINGADLLTAQHFVVAADETVPGVWTEYTGYVMGTATPGTGVPCPDPDSPGQMHTDVRWIRPYLVVNYNGEAGICDVDTFSIDVISDPSTLGLGSMAYQDADAVDITGGTVDGLGRLGVNGGAYFESEIQNYPESGGTEYIIDWRLGNKQAIPSLENDCTLTFIDPLGAASLILRVVQDAVGGHTLTLPADTMMVNGTSFTLTATANAEDILTFYFPGGDSGTAYRCSGLNNFSVPGSGA